LGLIFAGTGDLEIMRRLRVQHGKISDAHDYGAHMATHMTLGLLFFGKGRFTFSTKPAAIAALYCALYPAFPSDSADNRSHLQAARHMWTLATEPRCLVARDVDSGQLVQVPFKIRLFNDEQKKTYGSTQLVAPSLFPQIDRIHSIKVETPRYYPLELNMSNPGFRSHLIKTRTIFVKRHAGSLDYAADPTGVRGLDSLPGGEAGSTVFDLGQATSRMLQQANLSQEILSHYSSDPRVQAIFKYLPLDDQKSTAIDLFTQSVMLECLKEDKMHMMAVYHRLFAAVSTSTEIGQLDFICDFYTSLTWLKLFGNSDKSSHLPLINRAFVEYLTRQRAAHLAKQLRDSRTIVLDYLRSGTLPLSIETRQLLDSLRCPPFQVLQHLRAKANEVLASAPVAEKEEIRGALMLVIEKVLEEVRQPMAPAGQQDLARLILESCG
jgi:anaphase-promoting complex subunit 1